MKQVAERILGMQGPLQRKAIEKMRGAGMGPWSFPIPRGVQEPRAAALTPEQQEMYATQVANPDDPRFHLYGAFELPVDFDRQTLVEVMRVLCERHGILRTRFVHRAEAVVQEMVPSEELGLEQKIRRTQGQEDRQSWLESKIAEPISLHEAGLWRIEISEDAQGSVLLALFHHLIMDAWSMGQLVRELGVLLGSGVDKPTLPEATHFVDYAHWRSLWHEDERLDAQRQFWRGYLGKVGQGWQTSEQRACAKAWGQGQKFEVQWPQALSDALHQSAQGLGETPFMLLLAGFHELLGQIDASQDWVVASTVADRPCQELESSLGYFVKTLMTRSPHGEARMQRLQSLGEDWRQARAQDQLPFGRMLKALREDGAAKSPSILFVLHNTPKGTEQGRAWKPLSLKRAFARFAWSIRVDATPGAQVRVSCEFDTARFEQPEIAAAMRVFERGMRAWLLPESCAEEPETSRAEFRSFCARWTASQAAPESATPVDQTTESSPAPYGEIEARLCEIWASVLGVERVQPEDNFFALGGDSISSLQVVSRALRQGWILKAQDLASAPTLAQLATRVRKATLAKLGPATMQWTEGPRLTAAQRWFFELGLRTPQHFNQSYLLVTRPGLSMKQVLATWGQLLIRHEAMRVRFIAQNEEWGVQPCAITPDSVVDFLNARVHHIDQSKQSEEEARAQILAKSQEAMLAHDLSEGGLFQVLFFDRGFGQEGRMLIVMHHLIVDGVSWRLLLSQCEALATGQSLAPVWASPFGGQAPKLSAQTRECAKPLRADSDASSQDALAQCTLVLPAEALKDDRVKDRSDALLAAWVQTVAEQQACPQVVVDLESHGRQDGEAALCIGWMTQRHSLVFDAPTDAAANRSLIADPKARQSCWRGVSLCFNDHGQARVDLEAQAQASGQGMWARPLRLGQEPVAPARDPQDKRPYPWVLNCFHHDQEVHLHWLYDPRMHKASTIEDMLGRMKSLLCVNAPTSAETNAPALELSLEVSSDEDMDSLLEVLNQ